jgi:hypothetical protein
MAMQQTKQGMRGRQTFFMTQAGGCADVACGAAGPTRVGSLRLRLRSAHMREMSVHRGRLAQPDQRTKAAKNEDV